VKQQFRCRLTPFLLAAAILSIGIRAAYAETRPRLEVNIGPLWVDQYTYNDINTHRSVFPACSATLSVRGCMQKFLSYYAKQGVTGIRFQFALGGGAGSTPFNSKGQVNAVWLVHLKSFFSDVRSAGIKNVTPTSTLNQSWSGSPGGINLKTMTVPFQKGPRCTKTGTEELSFFPWLPYGLNPNDPTYSPADKYDNEAYYCSPKNPIFWGWTPFFNLVDGVAKAAEDESVNIEEWDVDNELDLWNFTNEAREAFDPVTNTPVLSHVGAVLASHGFKSGAATFSVTAPSPSIAAAGCNSVYGVSAYATWGSELLAAETGGYIGGAGGFPNATSAANGNLTCSGTTSGMIRIHKQPSSWKPGIFDFHVYVCIVGASGCDLEKNLKSTAQAAYDGIWEFFVKNNFTHLIAMIGETDSDAPNIACDGHTQAMAAENARAFRASDLFTDAAARSVIRPWAYLVTPGGQVCQPVVIGLPNGIYANL
jgi:hypothetical protein